MKSDAFNTVIYHTMSLTVLYIHSNTSLCKMDHGLI